MKKSKRILRNRKSGMTLVELVVFMSLTLLVIGGLFPMISMAMHMDHAGEEKVAAFFHCKSVLEELRTVPFEGLADPGDGFNQEDGSFVRKIENVPFHTRGGAKHTELKATETTVLTPGATNNISYYAVSITLEWNSSRGIKNTSLISESLATMLYQ